MHKNIWKKKTIFTFPKRNQRPIHAFVYHTSEQISCFTETNIKAWRMHAEMHGGIWQLPGKQGGWCSNPWATQNPLRNITNKNMHGLLISLGEHENRFLHIFLCIKKHISHLCIGGALPSMLANQLAVFDSVRYTNNVYKCKKKHAWINIFFPADGNLICII